MRMGGGDVASTIVTLFSALAWHTQVIREDLERYGGWWRGERGAVGGREGEEVWWMVEREERCGCGGEGEGVVGGEGEMEGEI